MFKKNNEPVQPTANMFEGIIKMFKKDWCTVGGGVVGKEEQKIKLGVKCSVQSRVEKKKIRVLSSLCSFGQLLMLKLYLPISALPTTHNRSASTTTTNDCTY